MSDLLHKCTNNPAWAAACIEGLEGELKAVRAVVERVSELPEKWLNEAEHLRLITADKEAHIIAASSEQKAEELESALQDTT